MATGHEPPAVVHRQHPLALLIDDHEDTRLAWALFLGHQGFMVETAGDGVAGLAQALTSQPDVIVLDLMLPVQSGTELAHELKRRSETKAIPIIVVTGMGPGERDLPTVDGFLQKPCAPDEVLAEIRRVLTGSRQNRG